MNESIVSIVRSTPKQELGHPSNKALEALSNYINTEAYIRSLRSEKSEDEGIERLIKETRGIHLALLDELTPAEKHFYHKMKFVLENADGENINEDEIQDLKRSGFSANQVQEFLRLFNIYHPKDSPSA